MIKPPSYIAVAAEVLQKLDLSKSSLCENFLAEDIGDLFDSNAVRSRVILCRARGGVSVVDSLAQSSYQTMP